MKVRIGFVSNSSSSSFVLNKYYLSEFQLENLKDPSRDFLSVAQDNYGYEESEMWRYVETETTIEFSTGMDNFNLEGFAEFLGVPERAFIEMDI